MQRSKVVPKDGHRGMAPADRGPGFEFWTPRPGNECANGGGTWDKRRTHRLERRAARREIESESA